MAMGISLKISISEKDLNSVKTLLQGIKDGAPKVTLRAMNKTLTGIRTDITDEVGAILTAPKAVIENAVSVNEATLQRLSGSILVTGKPLPLSSFSTRQTPTGISVQVKKGRPHAVIPGTFIITTKYGRPGVTGVYWRKWHAAAAKGPRKNIPYKKLPEFYRLPIRELFSSSVANIAGDEPVMTSVLKKADERLHENLEHELDCELSKL
jgi:hypothetical protein